MLGLACFIISLIHMFKRVLCKQKLTGIAFLDVLCCKVQASQFKDVLPGIETRRPVRSQLFCSCATSSFPLSHGCKAGCCDSARACPRPWPSAWFLWHWQTPFHLKKHPNCCYIAWKYQTILQMLSVLISKTCSALHVDSVLEMILMKQIQVLGSPQNYPWLFQMLLKSDNKPNNLSSISGGGVSKDVESTVCWTGWLTRLLCNLRIVLCFWAQQNLTDACDRNSLTIWDSAATIQQSTRQL